MNRIHQNKTLNIQRFCRKSSGQWVVAFIWSVLYLAVVFLLTPVVFFINDDTNILYTLAGYYNGIPKDIYYPGYPFSWLLQQLYHICPYLSWYGLAHIFSIFISLWVIRKSIIKELVKQKISWAYCIPIYLVLDVFVFYVMTSMIQFTVTAGILGAAACSSILSMHPTDTRTSRIFDGILAAILMALSCCFRINSAKSAACFVALACVGQISYHIQYYLTGTSDQGSYRELWQNIRLILGSAFLAVLLAVAIVISGNIARGSDRWQNYFDYERARVSAMDYPIDSFDENPELYESIDWTKKLSILASTTCWFSMDPRITQDNYSYLSENSKTEQTKPSLSLAWDQFVTLYKGSITARNGIYLIVLGTILSLLFWLLAFFKKKHLINVTFALFPFGGAIVLCFALCWNQRIPLRAFQCIFLPMASCAIVFLIRSLPVYLSVKKGIPVFLSVVATVITAINCQAIYADVKEQVDLKVVRSMRTLSAEHYAQQNPENLYIYDISLTFRYLPFITYPDNPPTNFIFWGGVSWASPPFFDRLEMYGLDHLYSDILMEDDVYYITYEGYTAYKAESATACSLYSSYLLETYGICGFEVMEEIAPEVYVLHALPDRIDLEQNGWQSKYGQLYYVQNGHVLIGTQELSGQSFFFSEDMTKHTITLENGNTAFVTDYASRVA